MKPSGRVKDPELLSALHLHWRSCALCGSTGYSFVGHYIGRSLHHISNKPRDDVKANLIMLCGDGTHGCHGLITMHDELKKAELAAYLRERRPDTLAYLDDAFPQEGADHWLQRVLGG